MKLLVIESIISETRVAWDFGHCGSVTISPSFPASGREHHFFLPRYSSLSIKSKNPAVFVYYYVLNFLIVFLIDFFPLDHASF